MAYTIKTEQFDGPFQVLLELIEASKLDVSKLSLTQITDDYCGYIENNKNISEDELADFLLVASKLVYLKSKALLPFLVVAEDEAEDLASQLKIYQEYFEASKKLEQMFLAHRVLYAHSALPKIEIGFCPPETTSIIDLATLFQAVLKRLEPYFKPPRAILEKMVSIHEKISLIRNLLNKVKLFSWSSFLKSAHNRTEVVVSFLALLELVKQRTVLISQTHQFDDMSIEQV